MARLYWRVKRDGKWKFIPMDFQDGVTHQDAVEEVIDYIALQPECEDN